MLKIAWMYLLHNSYMLYLTISLPSVLIIVAGSCHRFSCGNLKNILSPCLKTLLQYEHNGCFNGLCNFRLVSTCTKAFLVLAIAFKCSSIMWLAEEPSEAVKSLLKGLGKNGF